MENHLKNIGKHVSETFGKSKDSFKIIFSESPQVGVIQVELDNNRISDILELIRIVKRYYVGFGFRIKESENEKEVFDVLKKETNENYNVSVEYNKINLTISISDLNEGSGEFKLFKE